MQKSNDGMLLHEDIKAKRTAAMFTCTGLVLDPRQFGEKLLCTYEAPSCVKLLRIKLVGYVHFRIKWARLYNRSFWVGVIPQRRNLWSDECQVENIIQRVFDSDGDIWMPIPAPRIWRQMQPIRLKNMRTQAGLNEFYYICDNLSPDLWCAHLSKFPWIMHELMK